METWFDKRLFYTVGSIPHHSSNLFQLRYLKGKIKVGPTYLLCGEHLLRKMQGDTEMRMKHSPNGVLLASNIPPSLQSHTGVKWGKLTWEKYWLIYSQHFYFTDGIVTLLIDFFFPCLRSYSESQVDNPC